MALTFAFAGRVSTEDQQDPQASHDWQLDRAQSLITSHGEIVAEYFDVGQSRAIPWARRPRSAALLEALKHTDRGFEAVVIGEPQRAFYGPQFGLTFPLFEHYGVQLWVPEVGGPIDPQSEAHDLVMTVYGGMSKGEGNRVKVRTRTAMATQARLEGRFLAGRPPYGYRLVDAGPHPNPAKAAAGQRLRGLAPDPVTAPVVQRIFREYLSGRGLFAIAEGLTRDGILCPSAYDADRNRHRAGVAWPKGAVRPILANPRYTGHQVWSRQRKDEVLLDVENVALGHQTLQRWNEPDEWVWSAEPVHEPLVKMADFQQAQRTLTRKGSSRTRRERSRTRHPYVFRGRLYCGICRRRMQGRRSREQPYYRCRFPNEYALANHLWHPRNVYLPEHLLLPPLDGWLARAFAPHRLEETIERMYAAQAGPGPDVGTEQANRVVRECDAKLAQYRRRSTREAALRPSGAGHRGRDPPR